MPPVITVENLEFSYGTAPVLRGLDLSVEAGEVVFGKAICLDYKTKKRRKTKENELIIFKNTHEAIIDEETWNNAQRLRKTIRRSPK